LSDADCSGFDFWDSLSSSFRKTSATAMLMKIKIATAIPMRNRLRCAAEDFGDADNYKSRSASVTAPSDALVTCAAYLASTPRV